MVGGGCRDTSPSTSAAIQAEAQGLGGGSMPLAAVVTVGDDDRVILRSPYDPALVDALKDAIPRVYREWDAAAKVWRVDPAWSDILVQALTAIGVSVVDKRPAVAPTPTVAVVLQQACQRLCILP